MKYATSLILATLSFFNVTVTAATFNFNNDKEDMLPEGWEQGVTGKGTANWLVLYDPTGPGRLNILQQLGRATFTWCVRKDVSIADGYIEVKFKPISGKEDQAAGVVWRFKDGNNYYVARANALENNVSLYYTVDGVRNEIQYVQGVEVPLNKWGTLRVEFSGEDIKVFMNGKKYIETKDNHISGAGTVGMWTKADSISAFDDFSYGPVNNP